LWRGGYAFLIFNFSCDIFAAVLCISIMPKTCLPPQIESLRTRLFGEKYAYTTVAQRHARSKRHDVEIDKVIELIADLQEGVLLQFLLPDGVALKCLILSISPPRPSL